MRIGAAAAPCTGPALRVNKTPRAIWAVSEKGLKNEPEAVLTVSVHAARRKPMELLVLYGPRMCSFQGAPKRRRTASGKRACNRVPYTLPVAVFLAGSTAFSAASLAKRSALNFAVFSRTTRPWA